MNAAQFQQPMNAAQLRQDALNVLLEAASANRNIHAKYDVSPNLSFMYRSIDYIVGDVCAMIRDFSNKST